MPNYIEDENPFNLPAPPAWWLRRLLDFDESLVVIPSRQDHVYKLAQRRPLTLPEHITNQALWKFSDTRMLAKHGLIPITSIRSDAHWDNPAIWVDLAERAPHRQGGAEKMAAKIEAMEARAKAARDKTIDDNNTERAKDGWKHYQALTGARTSLATPRRLAPGQLAPLAAPQGSPLPKSDPILYDASDRKIIR